MAVDFSGATFLRVRYVFGSSMLTHAPVSMRTWMGVSNTVVVTCGAAAADCLC